MLRQHVTFLWNPQHEFKIFSAHKTNGTPINTERRSFATTLEIMEVTVGMNGFKDISHKMQKEVEPRYEVTVRTSTTAVMLECFCSWWDPGLIHSCLVSCLVTLCIVKLRKLIEELSPWVTLDFPSFYCVCSFTYLIFLNRMKLLYMKLYKILMRSPRTKRSHILIGCLWIKVNGKEIPCLPGTFNFLSLQPFA